MTLQEKYSKEYEEKKGKYFRNLNEYAQEADKLSDYFANVLEEHLEEIIKEDLKRPIDCKPQEVYELSFGLEATIHSKMNVISLKISNFSFTYNKEIGFPPPADFIREKLVPQICKKLKKKNISMDKNEDNNAFYNPFKCFISL